MCPDQVPEFVLTPGCESMSASINRASSYSDLVGLLQKAGVPRSGQLQAVCVLWTGLVIEI